MNVIDNVRRAFRSKYFFDVQTTWLQPCLAWLRDQFQLAELTNNYTLEKIYDQWLHTDISLIVDACCLPSDLDLNAKKIQLSGRYALQINSILCISEPYYSQISDMHGDQNENERIDTETSETQQWKPAATKRVLYLELTDGKVILRGLEYEPISALNRDTTLPGAKILVTGPVLFRRGMLLLTPKNTQVLGGYVEDLIDRNASMETALLSLSKTASKSEEGRLRFNRLTAKIQNSISSNNEIVNLPEEQRNHNNFHEEEDEMDEFIRQAYADGMLADDSQMASDTIYNPSASNNTVKSSVTATSSFISSTTVTTRIATTTTTATTTTSSSSTKTTVNNNNINNNNDFNNKNNGIRIANQAEECILISDDDDFDYSRSPQTNIVEMQSTLLNNPTSYVSPDSPIRPLVQNISLPYTYLSLINHQMSSSNSSYRDFTIKGCFSSLVSNPRLVKNEFDLQAYVNDGSDCILVRLASDLLAQRIGMTVTELMTKRKECKTDQDKQKLQMDFNERLKTFGHDMSHLNAVMTIRFFSNSDVPMVTKIDDN